MKKFYITILLCVAYLTTNAQGYQLGVVHTNDTNFKVVAISDFASSGNTDISDVGFTLVLPAGIHDVASVNSMLAGRTWTAQQFDAAFLSGLGLGDGSVDVFQFNMPPGQTLLSHGANEQIDLVSFEITNSPTTGEMSFLPNNSPIAMGAGGVLDSFFNSNIDGSSTGNYFSSIDPALNNFMFSTLSIDQFLAELSNAVKLYPNPATSTISIDTKLTLDTVEIYNVLGKQVMQIQAVSNQTIPIEALQSGVYIMKIHANHASVTKRFVKK